MKKVSSEVLDLITRRLVEEFAPEQIYLFGSHAWGKPDADSDLDLLVIVEKSDQLPARRAARAYLCLQEILVPLDILVKTRSEVDAYRHVYASLTAQILEQGKVLYG